MQLSNNLDINVLEDIPLTWTYEESPSSHVMEHALSSIKFFQIYLTRASSQSILSMKSSNSTILGGGTLGMLYASMSNR